MQFDAVCRLVSAPPSEHGPVRCLEGAAQCRHFVVTSPACSANRWALVHGLVVARPLDTWSYAAGDFRWAFFAHHNLLRTRAVAACIRSPSCCWIPSCRSPVEGHLSISGSRRSQIKPLWIWTCRLCVDISSHFSGIKAQECNYWGTRGARGEFCNKLPPPVAVAAAPFRVPTSCVCDRLLHVVASLPCYCGCVSTAPCDWDG